MGAWIARDHQKLRQAREDPSPRVQPCFDFRLQVSALRTGENGSCCLTPPDYDSPRKLTTDKTGKRIPADIYGTLAHILEQQPCSQERKPGNFSHTH